MHEGVIPIETLSGGFDLHHTLESGQSYRWQRRNGEMYGDAGPSPRTWYETVITGTYVRLRQRDGRLEWNATDPADGLIRDRLRLDDDLTHIYRSIPDDQLIDAAIDRFQGMRLVRDPPFPCLISFICSAQMRVERIHEMQVGLAEAYGDRLDVEGESHWAFPTPDRLASASEAELRSIGLGYRAPYVLETARMVANGDNPETARTLSYGEAREYLTRYPGVGEKVADCVLLFSLDFLEAVPLDTWIRKAIERYFPECARPKYGDTSRAIRERFGGPYAGYAQTYVFHYLRTDD